ncbi:MAG: hypothetical protein K6G08_04890 [Prevotella sp.]|nr:hypothetical protein [Prevotella sp.]
MKKVLFALFAAMFVGFAFTACDDKKSSSNEEEETDYCAEAKDIVADIEKNGNDWDAEKWESVMEDAAKLEIDFYKSEPSKEAMEEFNKVKLDDAFDKLNESAKMKAFAAIMKVADKYKDELNKAEEAARAAVKDDDADAGDDADYYYDDADDTEEYYDNADGEEYNE